MSKSVLRLRELDAQSTQDEPLLELFQQSRKSVLRVATSPLQPNDLIVTTENGFIELVHVSSGEFRLFITHLQSMPLNAAIRCLSLAPCLTILTKRLHVVYSLSYSNEVLVTDINSGSVTVLAALSSRPSTVDCDGDYIACGEGSGQISVWRATAETGEPQPLWTAPIFNDVVSSLLLLRDRVICCCADFTCSVVHVDTGATLSTISHDPDYVVAVMPMTHPVVCHAVLGVCLRHSICVYSEQASDTRTDASPPEWRYCGCEPSEVEVRAATCLDGYMAVGTLSGEVVLYQCDAVSYDVTEVARFDVGFGVVQLQLYPNSTLLVVTNVGDVWNWTLEELLAAAKGDAAEESSHVVEGVNDMTNPLFEPPCPIPYDADAVDAVHASEAEADPLDKRSIGTTSASGARNKSSNSNSSQRGSVNSSYRDAEEVVIIDVNCSGEDEDERVSPIPNPCTGSRTDGVDDEPKKLSGPQQQTEEDGALAVAAVEDAQSNEGADAHHSAATLGEGPSSAGPMTLVKPSPQQALLAEACELLSKELGPVAEIGGLRQGKRLDPRKIEAVLENYYLRTGGNVDEEGPLMPEELHSTRLLREQQVVLAEVPFDYDAFIAEHPLEAAALPYQHPVVLPAYRPEENVYQGISAPNTQQLMGSEGPPDSGDTLPVDPLMDATYLKFSRRKDPELEEERRRGGPNIWEHPCRHLLFPTSDPSSTVLFTEYHMKPAPAGALMLPMPLPPTSSVF